MSPQELYQDAGEVLRRCNPEGVTTENAAKFIEQLVYYLRLIGGWLPPANGTVGYGDAQIIDHLRQVSSQAEKVLVNFPMGVEALSLTLQNFRTYLKGNYDVGFDQVSQASNW